MSGLIGVSTGVGACFREARAAANNCDSEVVSGMFSTIFLWGGGGGGGGGGGPSAPNGAGTGLFDNFFHL